MRIAHTVGNATIVFTLHGHITDERFAVESAECQRRATNLDTIRKAKLERGWTKGEKINPLYAPPDAELL